MSEGVMTYEGMAPPLFGEYEQKQQTAATDIVTLTGASSQSGDFLVLQDSSGTEKVWINADGCIFSRGSTVTATAYLGLDARGAVDAAATGTWFATVGARLTSALATGAGTQQYALYGAIYDTGIDTGGRMHTLGLYYSTTEAHAGNGACSFIYFVEAADPIPYFFTIGGMTADESGGCFKTATNATIDHALKIDIDQTSYYIGLYDATS